MAHDRRPFAAGYTLGPPINLLTIGKACRLIGEGESNDLVRPVLIPGASAAVDAPAPRPVTAGFQKRLPPPRPSTFGHLITAISLSALEKVSPRLLAVKKESSL